jgi:hypothetical protein
MMKSLIQPQQRLEEEPPTPGKKGRSKAVLVWFHTAWRWLNGLPLWLQVSAWTLLAIVFASPHIVALYLPVILGLWLWESIHPVARWRAHRNVTRIPTRHLPGFDLGRWLRHLGEMVVAMYVGMWVYMALVKPVVRASSMRGLVAGDFSYLWMVAFMAAPMVALMRLERHDWRMIHEMVGGMVAPVVLCFGLVRLGICPLTPLLSWLTPQNLYGIAHDAMLLGMIAVMVLQRRMYTNVAESDPMQTPQAHMRAD